MAKIPFNISKNEQYIECHRPFKLPNGKYSGMIRVYELLNPSKPNMLTTMDWSFKPEIVDPNATAGYNSLQIDGQLVNLEKLVHDLCMSRLRVNKLGYCYFQIMRGVADTTETFGFAFYRMNDMLRWSDYGVSINLDKFDTRKCWDQLDILHGSTFDIKKIDQKDNNDTVNEQKAQIQELTDRVKILEAQLELNVPPHLRKYYVPATSSALFDIMLYHVYPYHRYKIIQYWVRWQGNKLPTYTPTCVPVTTGECLLQLKLSIGMNIDQKFDTSNWYFVGVKELSTPILVYEGTMHSVNMDGHAMSSPIDGSARINYAGPFFGHIFLVGIGHRISARLG